MATVRVKVRLTDDQDDTIAPWSQLGATVNIYRRVPERKLNLCGHVCRKQNNKRLLKMTVFGVTEDPNKSEKPRRDDVKVRRNMDIYSECLYRGAGQRTVGSNCGSISEHQCSVAPRWITRISSTQGLRKAGSGRSADPYNLELKVTKQHTRCAVSTSAFITCI